MLRNLVLTTLLFTVFVSPRVTAQKRNDSTGYAWVPEDVIPMNDSMAVFKTRRLGRPVKGALAIVAINWNGMENGEQIKIPDNTLGMALLHGNPVVFYQPENKKGPWELHALSIDLKQGKTGPDKIIYTAPPEYFTTFSIERGPGGDLLGILIRVTGYKTTKRAFSPKNDRQRASFYTTSALNLVMLSDDLAAHATVLSGAFNKNRFVGGRIDKRGSVFLLSRDSTGLVAEKFNHAGVPEGRLIGSFMPRKGSDIDYRIRPEDDPGNALQAAIRYVTRNKRYAEAAFRFDFAANRTWAAKEDTLDKRYSRALKADTGQPVSARKANLSNIQNLMPVGITETRDRVVICKEIQYVDSYSDPTSNVTTYTYVSGAALLCVYDKQMNLQRTIIIDKSLGMSYSNYPGINIHPQRDSLYAVTSENPEGTVNEYVIDLKGFDKRTLKKGAAFHRISSRVRNTVWFEGRIMANYTTESPLFASNQRTYFLKVAL